MHGRKGSVPYLQRASTRRPWLLKCSWSSSHAFLSSWAIGPDRCSWPSPRSWNRQKGVQLDTVIVGAACIRCYLPRHCPYAHLSAAHGHHTVGGTLDDEDPLAPGMGRSVDLSSNAHKGWFQARIGHKCHADKQSGANTVEHIDEKVTMSNSSNIALPC